MSPNNFRQRGPVAVDIPAMVFTTTDSALEVASIMASHDVGSFQASSILWDAMMGEDRILAVVSKRVSAVPSLPLSFKASTKVRAKAKAQEVADVLGGVDGAAGEFAQNIPDSTLRKILEWGMGIGAVPVQKIIDNKRDPWGIRLEVWHPQFMRWDYQQRRFMLSTSNRGQIALPRDGEDDPDWFVWAPYGQQYGWRRSIVRALCYRYLQRRWNDRDWSRYDEIHGIPARIAEYPASESASDKVENFIQDVRNIGSEPTLALPMGDGDKAGFGFRLVEATAKTYETFRDHRAEINQDMGILVLGENDTTGGAADSGAAGSYASKKVAATISQDKAREDAALGPCLRQNVFRQWAWYNYDDPELAPTICWETEPPEDDQARAQVLLTLGQSITALKAAVGNRIDEDALLERFDVKVTQDQAAYEVEHPPVDPTDPNGQGGAGGADGDGADPEGKADKATEPAALSAFAPVRYRVFQGLPIAVENPAGSSRAWYDADAKQSGVTTMLYDYGFIDGHTSGDGEELDCYVGPFEDAADVHIVHQLKAPDFATWDEDKVMLGFSDANAAKAAFLAHRNDEGAFGGMSTVPLSMFKAKLKRRNGSKKITASALSSADLAVFALKSMTTDTGRKRLYPEKVAAKGAVLAGKELAPYRAALVTAIRGAKDEADAKARITKALKLERDPEGLARIVQQVRLMGNMGGRYTAVNQT